MGSSNSIINIVVKKLINIIGQDRDNDLIWYLNYLFVVCKIKLEKIKSHL